jgi:centrosomal protein CEP135
MDSTLQTTTCSSISEQKYVNLRKRLDQLGYRQTLGIESLPLIEKLFNDLVHTTESLKKTKLEVCHAF